jgi:LuxR family maltose regulon positive regulatory protein
MNQNAFSAGATRPIDQSRLAPPRTTPRTLAREDLNARLLEARRKRCVVIRGPAGCGKTTSLVGWRQQLLPLGFDVAWLSLSPDDNQLARFLDYLLASVGQLGQSLVQEAQLLEGYSTDSQAVERTIVTLVRGIARHPREMVLVLDDLHLITDAGIHQCLQWLLDYAPANLHLTLASRSAIPISLARLRSQDLVLELDLRDLRFSEAESARFLQAQLGETDPVELRHLHEMTDGWAAGLQLVAASRRKASRRSSEPAQLRDNQSFALFFEAEVLSLLSPRELELMLHLSQCASFSPSLCAALLGEPQAALEAAKLLARLEDDNLFVIAIESDDGEAWYRLHPLLQDTLSALFRSRPEELRRSVHARAADWFSERGDLSESVRHRLLAGEVEAAADFVEQRSEALYARGDLRRLMELVRLLPHEQLQARPRLRVLQARMQIYARDYAGAQDNLEHLESSVAPGDEEGLFRLTLLRATLALQRDDTDSAQVLLPRLLEPPPGISPITLGGSLNLLSWLYLQRGEYEQARRIQIDRPPLMVNGAPLLGTAAGSLQGRCLIGLSLAMEGQITQAERIYREVMYEAGRNGSTCYDALHLATALLGEALYETNEIDAAQELLASRVDLFERVSIPDSVLRVLVVLAKCQWLRRNRREAFAYLERLEEYGRRHELDRLQAYSLVWQVIWNLQLGELVAAETSLARLRQLDSRHSEDHVGAQREIHILTESALVRYEGHQGDLVGASLRLNKLIALCESGNRQLGVIRMTLVAALFDAQRGLKDSAHSKLLAALRGGQRHGQLRSLLDDHDGALELIEELAREQSVDPVLAFYIERLQEAGKVLQPATHEAPAAAPVGRWQQAPGMEPLSERELEVLRLLAQALPNKKIARALGLSHETVKWHLRHIYSKLGVSSRDEAVARLRDAETGS